MHSGPSDQPARQQTLDEIIDELKKETKPEKLLDDIFFHILDFSDNVRGNIVSVFELLKLVDECVKNEKLKKEDVTSKLVMPLPRGGHLGMLIIGNMLSRKDPEGLELALKYWPSAGKSHFWKDDGEALYSGLPKFSEAINAGDAGLLILQCFKKYNVAIPTNQNLLVNLVSDSPFISMSREMADVLLESGYDINKTTLNFRFGKLVYETALDCFEPTRSTEPTAIRRYQNAIYLLEHGCKLRSSSSSHRELANQIIHAIFGDFGSWRPEKFKNYAYYLAGLFYERHLERKQTQSFLPIAQTAWVAPDTKYPGRNLPIKFILTAQTISDAPFKYHLPDIGLDIRKEFLEIAERAWPLLDKKTQRDPKAQIEFCYALQAVQCFTLSKLPKAQIKLGDYASQREKKSDADRQEAFQYYARAADALPMYDSFEAKEIIEKLIERCIKLRGTEPYQIILPIMLQRLEKINRNLSPETLLSIVDLIDSRFAPKAAREIRATLFSMVSDNYKTFTEEQQKTADHMLNNYMAQIIKDQAQDPVDKFYEKQSPDFNADIESFVRLQTQRFNFYHHPEKKSDMVKAKVSAKLLLSTLPFQILLADAHNMHFPDVKNEANNLLAFLEKTFEKEFSALKEKIREEKKSTPSAEKNLKEASVLPAHIANAIDGTKAESLDSDVVAHAEKSGAVNEVSQSKSANPPLPTATPAPASSTTGIFSGTPAPTATPEPPAGEKTSEKTEANHHRKNTQYRG